MGRIGIVRLFERIIRGAATGSEVTVDTGGGENIRSVHFGSLGDDTQPVVGDYAVTVEGPGTGRELVIAYADPLVTPIAGPGEKRIYSRTASGALVAAIWLKADGSITIDNPSGSIVLDQSGTVTINGVMTIDATGNIVTTGTITAANVTAGGKSLAVHVHSGVTAGGVSSGPNV